ncbi:MAG: TIGR00300 family protein [Candidatus Hydrothermarchaeota archaeon]
MAMREIELKGHIIDSFILPKVFDTIMDMDGDFEVLEFEIGKKKVETSYARILIKGQDQKHLDEILGELHKVGAYVPEIEEVEFLPAPKDKTVPDEFYSTTNHPTYIRYGKEWLEVKNIEMDCMIVIDTKKKEALCKPIGEIKKGENVVIGKKGIRVIPPERPRGRTGVFEFMVSHVSTEKPSPSIIHQIANEMYNLKKNGEKIAWVIGPAVVHTGGAEYVSQLIRKGYVDVLLSGNALAVHDIECALFGTSLGMDITHGRPSPGGHRHHILAINTIMKAGSIKNAIEQNILKKGIMYECVKNNVPFILAGSIRDDGPLPEVITDVMEAQDVMREHLRDVSMVVMMASMLHSIAVGNLLRSHVKTVCVDINPATVTKLTDRGTAHALGVVTDVGVFLPLLTTELEKLGD